MAWIRHFARADGPKLDQSRPLSLWAGLLTNPQLRPKVSSSSPVGLSIRSWASWIMPRRRRGDLTVGRVGWSGDQPTTRAATNPWLLLHLRGSVRTRFIEVEDGRQRHKGTEKCENEVVGEVTFVSRTALAAGGFSIVAEVASSLRAPATTMQSLPTMVGRRYEAPLAPPFCDSRFPPLPFPAPTTRPLRIGRRFGQPIEPFLQGIDVVRHPDLGIQVASLRPQRQRTVDAGTVVDRCCGSVRLGSNPNGPSDILGVDRLRISHMNSISLLATSEVPPPVGGVHYSCAIAPILIVCAIV